MPRVLFYSLITSWMLLTVPAGAVIQRRIERQFEVPANASLKLDTFAGLVRVTEVPEGKTIGLVVTQTGDVATEAEMDSLLSAFKFSMAERDGAVTVTARYPKWVAWSWSHWPPIGLTFEARVPRRCDVNIVTREGDIVVGSLEGRVALKNESGDIFTGEITGPVTVRSHSGKVAITAASGAIDVSTWTGGIVVGRAGGHARLSSEGGYIQLQQASGGVVVRGDGSDAKVGFVSPVEHPADIEVSGGELAVILESDGACTLDLRASVFGKVGVRGTIPLKVTAGGEGGSRLEATVNGGGPRILARASGGNILVRGVEPLPVVVADRSKGLVAP